MNFGPTVDEIKGQVEMKARQRRTIFAKETSYQGFQIKYDKRRPKDETNTTYFLRILK